MGKHASNVARSALFLLAAVLAFATPSAAQPRTLVLKATVIAVFDRALTVSAAGTNVAFAVSGSTKFIGKGRGMLIPPSGRRFRLSDAVREGDRVTIEYREVRGLKHALRIQVNERELLR